MTDFFTALEHELRTAAEGPPRRTGPTAAALRGGGLVLVAAVLVAAVLIPASILVSGRSGKENSRDESHLPAVGTVIPEGEGNPPRDADSTVVATGTAPVSGPWQLEVYRGKGLKDPKTGAVYEPAGLSCIRLVQLDSTRRARTIGASGYCGPQLPGFTRGQSVPPARPAKGPPPRVKEILVYGRVPERATLVVITAGDVTKIRVRPDEGPKSIPGDFYVIPVKPPLRHARINWLDHNGKPGSRGIGLLPPLTAR